jgi:putative transcriptional regulator
MSNVILFSKCNAYVAFLFDLFLFFWPMSKDEVLKELGAHIRAVRKSKGMTLKELAHKIDKDIQSIQRLETGGINPTYYYLTEVAAGLGVDVKDLLV